MKLAVIQTCGWCSEYIGSRADGGKCLHPSAPQSNAVRNNTPPSWCPLRTGPDEERLAALEAVAEAGDRLSATWKVDAAEPATVVIDRIEVAEDALLEALRHLREVSGG